jgi:hypothetical protein
MKPSKHGENFSILFGIVTWAGLMAGCGDNITLGTEKTDTGANGTGGVVGTGGSGSGGTVGDAAIGTGGVGGSGGTIQVDASTGGIVGTGGIQTDGGAIGSGGKVGTGGIHSDGGVIGSGGKIGTGGTVLTGGTTGTGGSTQATCSGAVPCPTGQFCDRANPCDGPITGSGVCVPTGANVMCGGAYTPVCGCDGKTYSNNCARGAAGVWKMSDGACTGLAAYPDAWLTWDSPGGVAGTGPAVVVGPGFMDTWDSTSGWPNPEQPPSSATKTYSLTTAQTDDLFTRLAAVDYSSLPHPSGWVECYPTLYVRLCKGCTPRILGYNVPADLLPEMESVFAWFDQYLAASTLRTNPRNYCNFR